MTLKVFMAGCAASLLQYMMNHCHYFLFGGFCFGSCVCLIFFFLAEFFFFVVSYLHCVVMGTMSHNIVSMFSENLHQSLFPSRPNQ